MKRVKIFEPCDVEYPQKYDKPVRYSDDFLKEIASSSIGCTLVEEKHMGNSIGNITNLSFTDRGLFADVSTDKPLDNLKYSPSFDCTLIDNGDHWLATKGKLLEVALTSKPRTTWSTTTVTTLNNTADDNGGSNMSDKNETLEFFQNEVKRLQK